MNMLPNMALPNLTLVADSLGWAVLHSLWQGALAGCIVYGVRSLTRERASEARYFTGIVYAPLVTFGNSAYRLCPFSLRAVPMSVHLFLCSSVSCLNHQVSQRALLSV